MWKEIKFDEFLTQKKRHISIEPDTEYSLVTISNKGKVKLREVKNGATISAQTGYIAKEGDFIYSRLAVHTGAFGIVPAELDGAFITGEMPCFEINKNKILPEILVKMIGIPDFLWQLKQLTKGMGRVRIKENMLLSTSLIVPDIKQQKEIVEQIKSIETEYSELKNELTYQQTLIKKLRQQILQEAIEGKLTTEWRKRFSPLTRGRTAKRGEDKYEHASVLLERIIAEKNQMTKDKKIKPHKTLPPIADEDKPFSLPPGWVWCRLGEISINSLGKMLDAQKNKGELKPYLRNMNVQWFNVNTTDLKEMPFEKHETEKYSAIKGDILICEGGYPGQAAIWNRKESIMFQKALHRVRFIFRCFPSNLFVHFLWLWDKNGEIKKYFTGSGIKHLTGKQLNLMLIPLPPITEQNAIAERVEKLIALCDQLETKIAENKTHAEQLMRTVLKEAFAQKNE